MTLILGASCNLEFLEWVLTKDRKPKETEEGMAAASSKTTSSSGMSIESMRIESRPCSKVFGCFVLKGVILTTWFYGK